MDLHTDPRWPTKFGVFVQPLNDPKRDPTAALEDYMQLMEHLDRIGYDEAWIGEHHSGGWEMIGAPDIFIATAAERTKHIKFGTGVFSVTYHHPLILADRMCLLDHLTRGRVMFGMGPGALATDAYMFGIDPMQQRPRLQECVDVILPLLRGETVTRKTDWFEMRNAHLQLMPYSDPCFEICVAGAVSPSGARLAGRYGIGLLTVSATTSQTFDNLTNHWDVWEAEAEHYGQVPDRRRWRMCGPVHIAETEEQAREDVAHGLRAWSFYMSKISSVQFAKSDGTIDEIIDSLIESGYAVIGTPEQAIAQLKRLSEGSGGFGSYLIIDSDWAKPEAKRRSYELFAREVFPAFRRNAQSRVWSQDWVVEAAEEMSPRSVAARTKAQTDYAEQVAARESATQPTAVPEI
jgi:limonene 1,2-monooxygenase